VIKLEYVFKKFLLITLMIVGNALSASENRLLLLGVQQ
jgi:hypothetical protein